MLNTEPPGLGKLKRGIILEKNAFWIVSLYGMDCSLDSEHMFQVSGKYLQ